MFHKSGQYRGEKVRYPDGVGCCVWRVFPGEDEGLGVAIDFLPEDIDDLIALLQTLKGAEAVEFEDGEA
jgi:hypothetical protein